MAARSFTVRAVQSPKDSKWRVQIKAGNGKIVATGHQSYHNKYNADRAASMLAGVDIVHVPLVKRGGK